MNKFNKGKLVGIVAASLSAVSLMGVGFATWVIGYKNTEAKNEISISADKVEYKSLTVSVTFGDGITLGEDGTITSNPEFNYVAGTDKVKGDMMTSATFELTIGKDYVASEFNFKKVHFEIITEDGCLDNKPAATNAVFLTEREYDKNLTYFDAPAPIDIPTLNFANATKVDDLKNKVTFSQDLTFNWGSMFEHKSPVSYYDAGVKSATDKETYVENAAKELNAMHTKYSASGAKIKLKISLAIA